MLSIVLFLFVNPHWRLATHDEREAEIRRQYKAMIRAGFQGDPPCTVGLFFSSESVVYSRTPCALTDGKGHFDTLISITIGDKNCKISESEVRESSIDEEIEACKSGRLNSPSDQTE